MADDNTDKDGKDAAQAFQSRLSKLNGDAMGFATQLFDENFNLRSEKRALKAEIDEIKKKLPADGAKVLSADELKEYEAYQALGKAADLQKRIDAHATLETEVANLKKRDLLREVADLYGFKLSVLEDRDKAAGGLEFVVKEDKDKDKRKVAYIKAGDKETPLTEYAEDNWADYLPSLKAEQASPEREAARAGHGADPRPRGHNSNTAFEESRKSLIGSGKYSSF